jgi:hypothetical protein
MISGTRYRVEPMAWGTHIRQELWSCGAVEVEPPCNTANTAIGTNIDKDDKDAAKTNEPTQKPRQWSRAADTDESRCY